MTSHHNAGRFPRDDDQSIFLGVGDCDLNIFYSHQFIQNETSTTAAGTSAESVYAPLEYTPVIYGTLTGTVYRGTTPVQTFVVDMDGVFWFSDVGRPEVKAACGTLRPRTGELALGWTAPPGPNHVVVSYEYDMLPPKKPKRPAGKFKQPTFEAFFTSEELADIAAAAGTWCAWDFNVALGDTIKEKYESLHVKAVELNNVLISKGAAGYFWIVTPPEIASVFETATAGFAPAPRPYDEPDLGVAPQGVPEVRYLGAMYARWRLYADTAMPKQMLLMGCNDAREDARHYGRMVIHNFII